MFNPEFPDSPVAVRQGETAGSLGMSEERGVEIQTQTTGPGRIHPMVEMNRFQFISIHFFAIGFSITGMKIYPGKTRTPNELRADLDQALSLIPGSSPGKSSCLLC